MKFSILSTGKMAEKMARTTISKMDDAEAYAVASRSPEKARAFADAWGFQKAYGSYEELVTDPEVELVYIATPHSLHYENAKMCLEHGRHVLVEKPFTMNTAQAAELIAISEAKNLLLAEGIWTRYMPSRTILSDLLRQGAIGKVTSLTANLGYPLTHKARMLDPKLGGGALLDVGVYPLNFALMAIEENISELFSSAVMLNSGEICPNTSAGKPQETCRSSAAVRPQEIRSEASAGRPQDTIVSHAAAGPEIENPAPTGVDLDNMTILKFSGGVSAFLHSSMINLLNSQGTIYGEKGFLEVQNINNCEEIRQFDNNFHLIARHEIPEQLSGYEYEIRSCARAIAEGRCECPEMPHSESLRVMRLLDQIRQQW